jgi:hypothetical protein
MPTTPTEPDDDGVDGAELEQIDRAAADEVYQPTADTDDQR